MPEPIDVRLESGTLRVTAAEANDVGRLRSVQEDSHLAQFPNFIIADGMGGHAAGDVASALAISAFKDAIPASEAAAVTEVLDTIERANEAVAQITVDGAFAGAGTTLTGVVFVQDPGDFEGEYWLVINVGDSRVYLVDDEGVHQITMDHSAVQELVNLGHLTPAQAEVHPGRNMITRAIGGDEDVHPDMWLVAANETRRFLVCSDGLTKELDDAHISALLSKHPLAEGAATALVAAALESGGRDNVSVIVVDAVFDEDVVADEGDG